MKSIVITGADGFIGSHLVNYFSSRDMTVYAIIIKNSPTRYRIENCPHTTIIESDLHDAALLEVLPRSPIALIHLAWMGVSPEARNSADLQLGNIDLCVTAAKLAAAISAERFILPGSTAEYSYCNGLINRSALPSPLNVYGATKIACRYLCAAICEEYHIPYIYAVITGIYAADRKDNNIIYYTIASLLSGVTPQYTKLEQRWDYVHIDDVSEAFYRIALHGRDGAFYTIGHGDNCPLHQYIYTIRDIINPHAAMNIGSIPYKNQQLPSSCVDLSSLTQDTGFIPKIEFADGIRDVIRTVASDMNITLSI